MVGAGIAICGGYGTCGAGAAVGSGGWYVSPARGGGGRVAVATGSRGTAPGWGGGGPLVAVVLVGVGWAGAYRAFCGGRVGVAASAMWLLLLLSPWSWSDWPPGVAVCGVTPDALVAVIGLSV